jgi:hypothetical protein
MNIFRFFCKGFPYYLRNIKFGMVAGTELPPQQVMLAGTGQGDPRVRVLVQPGGYPCSSLPSTGHPWKTKLTMNKQINMIFNGRERGVGL